MATSAAAASLAMRAPSWPQSWSPAVQREASAPANASGVICCARASSGFTHGPNSAAVRLGKRSARFERSPFGSMASTGSPSMVASSISAMPSPVLPLPVMPITTAWVSRSEES